MDIRLLLPRTVRRILWYTLSIFKLCKWKLAGKPAPPPHIVKIMTIKSFAKKFGISEFVETGTYLGDTLDAVMPTFKNIYSIELSKKFYIRAKKQFGQYKNIYLIQGDSSKELAKVVKKLKHPTLFWLDAHYSGKGTARADKDTPINQEIRVILNSKKTNNIILIDDARMFTGKSSYPKLSEFKKYIVDRFPNNKIKVENDIIIIRNK